MIHLEHILEPTINCTQCRVLDYAELPAAGRQRHTKKLFPPLRTADTNAKEFFFIYFFFIYVQHQSSDWKPIWEHQKLVKINIRGCVATVQGGDTGKLNFRLSPLLRNAGDSV